MTEEEKGLIYLLAQKLTGAHPEGTYQIGIFVTNIDRRMHETGIQSVPEYLAFAKENAEEHAHLLSALSIHTTSWFRENPHYVILQKVLLSRESKSPYRAWSCATSTGEEVYSVALLCEEFRRFHSDFEYSILGTDIDPISLEHARRAIYDKKYLSGPIAYYKKHVLLGSGATEGYFTFSPEIRSRCSFKTHDIRIFDTKGAPYDLIMCRNILIYFQPKQVEEVISHLLSQLHPGGHLILGHSEMIDYQKFGLSLRGHSVYEKSKTRNFSASIRPVARQSDPVQPKPKSPAKVLRQCPTTFRPSLIVIGASTGGPEVLSRVLRDMSASCPPVVVAQHIASDFSRAFGERLAQVSGLKLGSFTDKTILQPGHLYCADANHHLGVERVDGQFLLRQESQPPINGHRPSVDHLFYSALSFAAETIAVLLSGMGRDGADGMQALHQQSAYTLAQSEEDCVVYGMPKEAIRSQSADFIGSGDQIHGALVEIIRRPRT